MGRSEQCPLSHHGPSESPHRTRRIKNFGGLNVKYWSGMWLGKRALRENL